jgi:hypothetical protein
VAAKAGTASDWPARAADMVEAAVAAVRDRSVRPLSFVARLVVFGVLLAVMLALAAAALGIAVVRVLDVYAFPSRPWLADAVLGAAFVGLGLVLSARRRPRRSASEGSR